jgi:hypothetical protein
MVLRRAAKSRQIGHLLGPFHLVGALAYPMNMTKLLEKALEAVRRLPPDSQDQIALAMLSLSGKGGEPEESRTHAPFRRVGRSCSGQAPPVRNRCRSRGRLPPL